MGMPNSLSTSKTSKHEIEKKEKYTTPLETPLSYMKSTCRGMAFGEKKGEENENKTINPW